MSMTHAYGKDVAVPSAEFLKSRPNGLNAFDDVALQLEFDEPPIPDGATVEQVIYVDSAHPAVLPHRVLGVWQD